MYLIDTSVLSEVRKGTRANPGVTTFFRQATAKQDALYLSAVSVGELRRGVELIRRRGDVSQHAQLNDWLNVILTEYQENILPFDISAAEVWGVLRVPDPAHAVNQQIEATALVNGLTLVTRNVADFTSLGVRLINPFTVLPDRH